MLKVKYVTLISLLATGCAISGGPPPGPGWDKGAQQPRALFHSVTLPQCVFFCTVTVSVSESERSGGNLYGGDARTEVTSSPSLSFGVPGAPTPVGVPE